MNIGTIVFAYNRSQHLRKVLEGLRKNKGVSKLYIFQDGLKCEQHRVEWENTQQVIEKTDWCEVTYQQSAYHKGLARSIVDGINAVFESNDAVVVLEDDCVPHFLFMDYITKCLEKYQENKKVFSINGYARKLDIESNGTDAYFAGRFCSWGWATWKDRWKLYEQDYRILARIRKDAQKSRWLDIWAQDAAKSLLGNIYGTCDSWAVFWGLKCIEQRGLCVTPYESFIDNIGCDGSGVHCGKKNLDTPMHKATALKEIKLPDLVELPENCEAVYADEFCWVLPETKLSCYNGILLQWNMLLQRGGSIAGYFSERGLKRIAIWGKGNLCRLVLNELENKVTVQYIIESKVSGRHYEEIPVISPACVTDEIQAIVVIPIYDMERIKRRINDVYASKLIGIDEILQSLLNEQTAYQDRSLEYTK